MPTPAAQWGAELTRQLARRRVSNAAVSRAAGVSESSMGKWRKGQVLPSYANAMAVAEALDSEVLATLIKELRTRTCGFCGNTFIVKSLPDAKFCTRASCHQAVYKPSRERYDADRKRKRTRRLGRTLAMTQRVVAATCAYICGGPFCPDAECPPQKANLSPYPVGEDRLVIAPKVGENLAAMMRRRWQDPDDKLNSLEYREERRQQTRAMWQDPEYRERNAKGRVA